MEPSRHIPTRITRYPVRVFEVAPDAPAAAPAPLPDRHVEAASVDEARAQAAALFAAERRPLRSLACLADGGLVAYVLPPLPAPEERPRRRGRGRR